MKIEHNFRLGVMVCLATFAQAQTLRSTGSKNVSVITILDASGNDEGHTVPTAINNKNVITGWYQDTTSGASLFGLVRDDTTGATVTFSPVRNACSTTPSSINNQGYITGND